MDDFEKFSDTSIPEREDFYSHLNMDDITNVDYAHKKRVCKDKILGEYHDLHVQSDTLLLGLKTFEICVLKYMDLVLQSFFHLQD